MSMSSPTQINQVLPRIVFSASLFVFAVAALHNLDVCFPFLVEDEYFKFQVAQKILRIFQGLDSRGDILSVPAHPLGPFLMYHDYVGWPALFLFFSGCSVFGKALGYFFVFRLSVVLLGLLTLLSVWCVLRRWFGEWSAALAVFFAGCNFSYIQAVQYGFFREEVFQICGLWSGLALCLSGQRRKKNALLYLGFFVFGITFWAKIMFAAYMIGAVAVLGLIGRRRREFIGSVFPSLKTVLLSGLAFVCGAGPFLWFNLRNKFPTLRLLLTRMSNFSQVNGDWDNSALGTNLLRRCHDFYLYLSGQVLFVLDTSAWVYVLLFSCAFVWGLFTVLRRGGDSQTKQRLRSFFYFYAVVFFLTCFLPLRHASGHVLIIVPFAGVLCALFLTYIGRFKRLLFVPVFVCVLWGGEQFSHMSSFSRHYIRNGQIEGLIKGERESLTVWVNSKNIKKVLCSNPVARVLNTIGNEWGIEFYDIGHLFVDSFTIANDIRLFISESMGQNAYMLICSGKNSATYTKIKDSVRSHGIKVEVMDTKTLRNNPACTFLFCRMTMSETKEAVSRL